MALTPALDRIGLNNQQKGFWGVQIERTIETYNHAHSFNQRQESLGSRKVYYELDHFHRSIRRTVTPPFQRHQLNT